jgi:very-short-patch-repair endonuclease
VVIDNMIEKIHNMTALKDNRKKLRNSLTPAEAKLWTLLKNSRLENRKFRRQHSVGPYVLDFYCPAEKLCIELDGEGHYNEASFEYDSARTEYLNSLNIRVLRFENKNVFENAEGVLEEIRRNITSKPTTPNPSLTKADKPPPAPSLTKEGSKGSTSKGSPPILGGDKGVVVVNDEGNL